MSTVTWRGVTLDPTTRDMMVEFARAIGNDIYAKPIQGSYSTGVSASAGTHAGGGAVDIDGEGYTDDQCRRMETAARMMGGVAYFRKAIPGLWQRHVHIIRRDCTDLSAAAKAQIPLYDKGLDALQDNLPDTGTRQYVGMTWAKYLADKAASTAAAGAASGHLIGADGASNQNPTVADAALRHDFLIIKATEGLHYTNPNHDVMVAAVRRAGKLVGHYHLPWCSQSPTDEFTHFAGVAKPQPGDVVMLDLAEYVDKAATPAMKVAYALKWLPLAKGKWRLRPVVYMNRDHLSSLKAAATAAQWAALTAYPVCIADYASGKPGVFTPVTWAGGVVLHQWTNNDGGWDGDSLLGDARLWASLAMPGESASSPLGKYLAALGVVLAAGGGIVATASSTGTSAPAPKPVVSSTAPKPAPAPAPKPVASTPPAPHRVAPAPRLRLYIVRRGDTLDGIARRFGTTWQRLAGINHLRHPGLIYPGQVLRLDAAKAPAHSRSVWVTVRRGDTLDGIARAHGTTWQHVARLTGLAHPSLIYPGQRVRVR